jgi:hypothetical protein
MQPFCSVHNHLHGGSWMPGETLSHTAVAGPAAADDVNDVPEQHTCGDRMDIGSVAATDMTLTNSATIRYRTGPAFADSHTNRRQEFGLMLKKEGRLRPICRFHRLTQPTMVPAGIQQPPWGRRVCH